MLLTGLGRYVDINAGPDQSFRTRDSLQRAFRLAEDVIGGKPRVRDLVIAALL